MAACGLNDHDLLRALAHCRFASRGQRPGFIPFNAPCVAERLAAADGTDRETTLTELRRWARRVGGDVVEGEVLWLPADRFGSLRPG